MSVEITPNSENQPSGLVSRRAVVRTGAVAGMTVPMIAVASEAQALSISLSIANLKINIGQLLKIGPLNLLVVIRLLNIGTGPTAVPPGLLLGLIPNSGTSRVAKPLVGKSSGAGWSSAKAASGNSFGWNATYGKVLEAGESTSKLQIPLTVGDNALLKLLTASKVEDPRGGTFTVQAIAGSVVSEVKELILE